MSNTPKILIHSALYPEAKPIIQHFNLIQNKLYEPLKIYENEKYILVVCGIGRKKTNEILPFIFEKFNIKKAVNIGIAGCKQRDIKLGSLFCCNQNLTSIPYASLTTVDSALDEPSLLNTILVDMEADAFVNNSKQNLKAEDIFVFKIVSDYLSKEIPDKSFVYNSIKKSIPKWEIVI